MAGAKPDFRKYTRSFQHAMDGVLDAYRSQRHMRVHFVFMGLNAVLAMVYKLSSVEVALITVCITMVVFAEMVNTVFEAALNMITEAYHPIAKFAKDVAAGGVLITAMGATVVAMCIYATPSRLGRLRAIWVDSTYVDHSATMRALAASAILLLVIITALKVGRPKGSILQGGPVSGHTAFAFCIATCVWFLVRQTTYAYLATGAAFVIAAIVAQLRIQDHGHRVRTVAYGALLGVLIPLLVFQLLARSGNEESARAAETVLSLPLN